MNKLLVYLFSFLTPFSSFAQVEKSSDLYKTILSKDSLLFNVGFNTCDISQFDNLLSEKFEFFHDKDSISYKKEFIYNLRNGLCISPTTYQSRRELVAESTEVYPLYKNEKLYGAIQMGVHKFYETIAGQKERYASAAKFTSVWLLENGFWKLNKCLSYNHKIPEIIPNKTLFEDKEITEKWLAEKHIPALGIGYIKDGKMAQISVFGNLEKGRPAPKNTIWNVASLTKPITANVALRLASEGKWDLDEPVYKYWTDPDIAKDPRHKLLTTRLILSHQTGFPNWRWNNKSKKLAFDYDPGKKYQYSGEGLEYLRKALEKKFNKTLDQLANDLIFKPLNMTDTKFFWDATVDSTRFAKWHNDKGGLYETYKNTKANGADDVLTTLEDYGHFLISIMNSEGLSKPVFDDMVKHQVKTKNGKYFGLGFEIYDLDNGEYALSHGGSDKGVQTIVFIFPKTKQGLIIFTNVDDGHKVYETLLKYYLGENGKRIFEIETK
jgi:CubicO group peptidase (beta-lactamase class C family)